MSAAEKNLSILLADDHTLTRKELETVIRQQSGWAVVGAAADGQDAVQQSRELKPDVLVMDVSMPGMTGIEAAQKIKKEQPQTVVLMVSNYHDEALVQAALKAGASGYISKQHAFEELVPGIRAVCSGEQYFSITNPKRQHP